jgi:hypothetical protein
MKNTFIRIVRSLNCGERTAVIVGALMIVGMLSAVAIDRLLAKPSPTVIVTIAPPDGRIAHSTAVAPNW